MAACAVLLGIAAALAACSRGSGLRVKGTGGTTVVGRAGGVAGSGSGGSGTGGGGPDAAVGTGGVASGGVGGRAGGKASDGGGEVSSGSGGVKLDADVDVPLAIGGALDAGWDAAAEGAGAGGIDGSATGAAGGSSGTGGSQVTCTATFSSDGASVVVVATLSCTSPVGQVNVAAGTGTNGFVSLMVPVNGEDARSSAPFFFDLGASSAKVGQIQPEVVENCMAGNALSVLGVVEELPGNGTALWLSPAAGASSPAWVSSKVTITMQPESPIACAIGPDGTEYAAFILYPQGTLAVATRPAGGSTFDTTLLSPAAEGWADVLAVDAAGALHVFYWIANQGLVDARPGQDLVTALASSTSGTPASMQVAQPNGLGVAVSVQIDDGIHVVRQSPSGAFDDIPIPRTKPSSYPVPTGLVSCTTAPGCLSLLQTGDSARAHALAQAADGTLWLVTVRDHIDRLARLETTTNDPCRCLVDLVGGDDHSSTTLAVQKIAPGATTPSDILWSYYINPAPWTALYASSTMLSASIAGAYLFLAVRTDDGNVRYLVLDTSGLS